MESRSRGRWSSGQLQLNSNSKISSLTFVQPEWRTSEDATILDNSDLGNVPKHVPDIEKSLLNLELLL